MGIAVCITGAGGAGLDKLAEHAGLDGLNWLTERAWLSKLGRHAGVAVERAGLMKLAGHAACALAVTIKLGMR